MIEVDVARPLQLFWTSTRASAGSQAVPGSVVCLLVSTLKDTVLLCLGDQGQRHSSRTEYLLRSQSTPYGVLLWGIHSPLPKAMTAKIGGVVFDQKPLSRDPTTSRLPKVTLKLLEELSG